ncbi:hypothetical protein E2C01_045975 [Portunus trituberculatus]|uniref:Uncharacterized protein n=1 Tax=Portunus trituberculatus TaxID=210409 RepID=A0A5B7G6D9_PORTR|nr:hypothetical protein [Portunus trituberculatus]
MASKSFEETLEHHGTETRSRLQEDPPDASLTDFASCGTHVLRARVMLAYSSSITQMRMRNHRRLTQCHTNLSVNKAETPKSIPTNKTNGFLVRERRDSTRPVPALQ